MSSSSKLHAAISFLFLLLFGAPSLAQSEREIAQGYMDGQMIIRLDDEVVARHEQRRLLEAEGFRVLHAYPMIGAFFVAFDPSVPVPAMLRRYARRPEVLWVESNALGRRDQLLPNDSGFANCYALHNTGQTVNGDPGTADADMDCPEAWSLITDASAVRIAVVDSGCRITHTDLMANIWTNPGEIAGNGVDDDGNGLIDDLHGWDFLGDDGSPDDFDGHGTNVTGCIAMRGNNGSGGTGVCWQAQVMVIKDGDAIPQVALSAMGIEYAAMNGAVACNFSTGYGSGSYPVLQQAVNVAESLGMIICVAAGNSSQNLDLVADAPATYANGNLLVVAASNNDDGLTSFSNYGATTVDVAAAGDDVYTTSRFSNTAYAYVAGTSFSAPLATGCVGLMRAYNTGAGHLAVINAIISTADQKPAFSGKTVSNGRINLFAALIALGSGSGGSGPPAPDPMTFAVAPVLVTASTAAMMATTATPGPVEYKFDLVTSSGSGGTSSGWQTSSSYQDALLSPDAGFEWTVRARNASDLSETLPSAPAGVWTPAATPGLVSITNITNGGFEVVTIGSSGNPISTDYSLRVGNLYVGPGGQVQVAEYFQDRNLWDGVVVKGLEPYTAYIIRARARNALGILSAIGPAIVTTTSLLGPAAAGEVGIASGAPEQLFSINGSTGGVARLVFASAGAPFSFEVDQPSTMAQPANFAVIAWWGVPNQVWEFDIPPYLGHGRLVFTPCDANPGLPAFNVVSTFGSACGELLQASSLTPWTAINSGIPYPLPDITFQAIVEESPGVYAAGNAIIFRYQ
ncbi:MAG: S8 family serine peptidase [Planctomycetes bacterium]|nr:S8 family serine peptidase [Planctomycetota bacterium]